MCIWATLSMNQYEPCENLYIYICLVLGCRLTEKRARAATCVSNSGQGRSGSGNLLLQQRRVGPEKMGRAGLTPSTHRNINNTPELISDPGRTVSVCVCVTMAEGGREPTQDELKNKNESAVAQSLVPGS